MSVLPGFQIKMTVLYSAPGEKITVLCMKIYNSNQSSASVAKCTEQQIVIVE